MTLSFLTRHWKVCVCMYVWTKSFKCNHCYQHAAAVTALYSDLRRQFREMQPALCSQKFAANKKEEMPVTTEQGIVGVSIFPVLTLCHSWHCYLVIVIHASKAAGLFGRIEILERRLCVPYDGGGDWWWGSTKNCVPPNCLEIRW